MSHSQLRITKVGLWFALLMLVVGLAATNTGNNALYMVVASMLSMLLLSWLAAAVNLGPVAVEIKPPFELYANTPFPLVVEVRNLSRRIPRWLLQLELHDGEPFAVPHLARRARAGSDWEGEHEHLYARRGRVEIAGLRVSSLFPFGFFRRSGRVPLRLELVVFPELFPAASLRFARRGDQGAERSQRAGWGHDLRSLRAFREGDDPRGIHWRQSARTGELVFTERSAEDNRRLSIVLDNGVGSLGSEAERSRFERLVSEAATACVSYLDRGFEVELVTRDQHLPFGTGRRHRTALLTNLALLEPCPRDALPLHGSRQAPELRLVLDRPEPGSPPTSQTAEHAAQDGT
jgi:uncharacterized protein (DUF58 family)